MADSYQDPGVAGMLAALDLTMVGDAEATLRPRDGRALDDFPSLGQSPVTVFLGQSVKMPHNRVFGGQVLAQGVMAMGRTVIPDSGELPRPIHSLHAYFMRPGDDTLPIHFAVETMRDGRSFSTRRVHAIQHGAPILAMSASFQEPADGLDHEDVMPDVPHPEELPAPEDLALADGSETPGMFASRAAFRRTRSVEMRFVEGEAATEPDPLRRTTQHVWMRCKERLPDDPLLHAAVFAYCSDYSLLEPVLRVHGLAWTDRRLRVASLDHAMWFHRQARPDEWFLYTSTTPSAQSGRGLAVGRMFSADGRLIATTAQEGMVRVKD